MEIIIQISYALPIFNCLLTKNSDILNKNTKGATKVQGQSEAAIIDQKV